MVCKSLDLGESESAKTLSAYYKRYQKKKIGVFSISLLKDGQIKRIFVTSDSAQSKLHFKNLTFCLAFNKEDVLSCQLIGIKNRRKSTTGSSAKKENLDTENIDYSNFSLVVKSKKEEENLKKITLESGQKSNMKRNSVKDKKIQIVQSKYSKKAKSNNGAIITGKNSSSDHAASKDKKKADSSSKKPKRTTSLLSFFGSKKTKK